MTERILDDFRCLRRKYIVKGIGGLSPTEQERYSVEYRDVSEWIDGLEALNIPYAREIARLYWIGGYRLEIVAMHVHYSDRQVRRIRDKIVRSTTKKEER